MMLMPAMLVASVDACFGIDKTDGNQCTQLTARPIPMIVISA